MPALKYYDLDSGTYKYVTGGMSQAAADARYIRKSGDTMTGPLILSADPSAAMASATKQYVDGKAIAKVDAAGPVGSTVVANAAATALNISIGGANGGVTLTGTRINIPKTGWWAMAATVVHTASLASTTRAFLEIVRHDSSIHARSSLGVSEDRQNVSSVFEGVGGDQFWFQFFQNSGSTCNVTGYWWWAKYIGP